MTDFSERNAEQNEKDDQVVHAAIASGRLEAIHGVPRRRTDHHGRPLRRESVSRALARHHCPLTGATRSGLPAAGEAAVPS